MKLNLRLASLMPDTADAELELPVLVLTPKLFAIDKGGKVAGGTEGCDIGVAIDAMNTEPFPRSSPSSTVPSGSATNAWPLLSFR